MGEEQQTAVRAVYNIVKSHIQMINKDQMNLPLINVMNAKKHNHCVSIANITIIIDYLEIILIVHSSQISKWK